MRFENLLVELGTEELPPKALSKLAQAFADNTQAELEAAELSFEKIEWFAAPRRLAVKVTALAEQQQDKVIEKRGPAVSAAFDADGNATKAAEGWARSNGIEIAQAERLTTDKGEWLLHKAKVTGETIAVLLEAMISRALGNLPIPKPMRWGASNIQFIRPVHTLTMLYGDRLIDGTILGKRSGRTIQGHRFHGESAFELEHADNYLSELKAHYVLADFSARRETIRADIARIAATEQATADINDDLLDEVTSLVEWPVAYSASFDESFLQVPKEALIYTMKDDQKYFPLLDNQGELKAKFVFISNIDSADPSLVISGNEKVIRPRLADAEFFFNTDKKQSLDSRLDSLESVLFQKQLGTLAEKSKRISTLSGSIAKMLNVNVVHAQRAGLLSKTDLMTNMVMEFPDVQGVMGMHYARHDGEDEEVAVALFEQYLPRFAGDRLPESLVSAVVAIADKLDTLVGIFGIGQAPKGDKDPFALRRAAIGLLRISVELDLPLDLNDLVDASAKLYGDKLSNTDVKDQVVDFVLARFRTWYQEQGVDVDVIQAVLARRPTRPADFAARIKGVSQFKLLDSAEALAAANKRVGNILAKNPLDGTESIDPALFSESQEIALAEQLSQVTASLKPVLAEGDYGQVLNQLAGLRSSIDEFFDNVMVMADDEAIKRNRLALLSALRESFLQCADISLLSK